jgi:hypothetical protein
MEVVVAVVAVVEEADSVVETEVSLEVATIHTEDAKFFFQKIALRSRNKIIIFIET